MPEAVASREPARTKSADPQRAAVRRTAKPARPGIDQLQRTLGNAGMHRLLRSGGLQPKLTVGPADDDYEREADRVADEVMRMPDPDATHPVQRSTLRVQRACSTCGEEEKAVQRAPVNVQRMCAECEEEQEEKVQRTIREPGRISRVCPACAEKARRSPEPSSDLTSFIASRRGGGQPLAEPTRAYFESRFGHDFGGVRVHTDPRSAAAAAEINSLAFATGSDIHFGAGRFQPGTPHGDRLLAHELTHVVQQTAPSGSMVRRAPRTI